MAGALTQTDDELRALLALGIIASLAVLFQLTDAGIRFLPLPPPTDFEISAEVWSEVLVLGLFALYAMGLTLALGLKEFKTTAEWSGRVKRVSDLLYLLGSFSLILLLAVYIFRILASI